MFANDTNWKGVICNAEALTFLKGRLTVLLEASRQKIDSFVKMVEACTSKLSSELSSESEKTSTFLHYLSFAQNCDLPLAFDGELFNCANWKSMFFTDTRKQGVIAYLRSFIDENSAITPADWAANLQAHWNDICNFGPSEYQKIAVYTHGWENDKVFLYRTSDIRRAQLLSSSHRARLLEQLNPTAPSWRYEDYNVSIELGNGMTLYHGPDDVISIRQNNTSVNELGGYALPLKLSDENFDKVLDATKRIASSVC